jgi:hypothetical protein
MGFEMGGSQQLCLSNRLSQWHRQLVGCGQQVDWARGMTIYIIAAMLLISAQTWNVCVLDALYSAAVR